MTCVFKYHLERQIVVFYGEVGMLSTPQTGITHCEIIVTSDDRCIDYVTNLKHQN
jgi:hypothetical protein